MTCAKRRCRSGVVDYEKMCASEIFRHGTRLLRWRPDKNERECTDEQFEAPTPFSLRDIRLLAEQGSA